MIPPEKRPPCKLGRTFWEIVRNVGTSLAMHGFPDHATQFRYRAFELNQNDEDTSDILALALEYVEMK